MQFPAWLRSSVVRAYDWHSQDPGLITGGAAPCFSSHPAVSFSIFVGEKGGKLIRNDLDESELSIERI